VVCVNNGGAWIWISSGLQDVDGEKAEDGGGIVGHLHLHQCVCSWCVRWQAISYWLRVYIMIHIWVFAVYGSVPCIR
jgi:hypothetical protein